MAAKKSVKKPAKKPSPAKTRKLKDPNYKSFKLSKRIKHPGPKLPGAFKLSGASIKMLLKNKKLFLGILLIYILLTFILVRGLGVSGSLEEARTYIEDASSDSLSDLATGTALFSILVGSAGGVPNEVAGVYQSIITVLISLALIWGLRQIYADKKVSIRDTFYRGMYPLVPFLLVLLVIGLQLLPLLIGSSLYSIVIGNGLAITFLEKFIWAFLFGLLALLSLYMITSSIFALYIVTLPDVTPMGALRSARGLVRYRRWTVMRKVIFLPIALIIIAAAITIPLIVLSATLAEWVFFLLSMGALVVIHGYIYALYRELL